MTGNGNFTKNNKYCFNFQNKANRSALKHAYDNDGLFGRFSNWGGKNALYKINEIGILQ